jgi:hypothetical protein
LFRHRHVLGPDPHAAVDTPGQVHANAAVRSGQRPDGRLSPALAAALLPAILLTNFPTTSKPLPITPAIAVSPKTFPGSSAHLEPADNPVSKGAATTAGIFLVKAIRIFNKYF